MYFPRLGVDAYDGEVVWAQGASGEICREANEVADIGDSVDLGGKFAGRGHQMGRGFARLWRGEDRGREAHELLAPVYGWFTEGFDIPDLKEAKALLE